MTILGHALIDALKRLKKNDAHELAIHIASIDQARLGDREVLTVLLRIKGDAAPDFVAHRVGLDDTLLVKLLYDDATDLDHAGVVHDHGYKL